MHVILRNRARSFNVQGRLVHVASGRVYNSVTNPPRNPGLDDITGCYHALCSLPFRFEHVRAGWGVSAFMVISRTNQSFTRALVLSVCVHLHVSVG